MEALKNTMNEPSPLSSFVGDKPKPNHISHIEKLLSTDPEALSKEELYNLKLSVLSKNIGKNLSSRQIVDVYLNWLEVQRLGPTHGQNLHWDNLQKQWVVHLKLRGFTQTEIIEEAQLRQSKPQSPQGRATMTDTLVRNEFASGFDTKQIPPQQPEAEERSSHSISRSNNTMKRPASSWDHGDDEEEERYYDDRQKHFKHFPMQLHPLEPNNMHYTCKRCKIKGHLLNVCPTNIDPAYDKPPNGDYRCKGCQQAGVHYYTLCYKNPAPDSIYQQRVQHWRKEREQERERERYFGAPTPRFKPQEVHRLRYEDDTEIADDLGMEADPKRSSHKSNNTPPTSSLRDDKSSSKGKQDLIAPKEPGGPAKSAQILNEENSWARKFCDIFDPTRRPGIHQLRADNERRSVEKERLSPSLKENSTIPGSVEQRHRSKSRSDHGLGLYRPEVLAEEMQHSGKMQNDHRQRDIAQPGERSSPRVQQMRLGLPKDFVNKRPKRPTALELWDRDDEARAQRSTQLQAEKSPLDTFEPQVLRVSRMDIEASEMDVCNLFDGFKITAISLWKPDFIPDTATVSAFVSLLSDSKKEALRCRDELDGRHLRSNRISVTQINTQDAFQRALKDFQNDVDGNKKWQEITEYVQRRKEHLQILQHLRLTAAFKQTRNPSSVLQELPNRHGSLAPSSKSTSQPMDDEYESGSYFTTED